MKDTENRRFPYEKATLSFNYKTSLLSEGLIYEIKEYLSKRENEMSKKKVLITGGAGFIGNSLVNELMEHFDIVVLDNLSPQIHGDNYEQSFLFKQVKDKVTLIKGDVRDYKSVEKALDGVEYIIHLAAETGTGQSMYEINKYTEVNISGTANILQVILDKKVPIKKILLSSSRSVYGEGMYRCPKDGVVLPASRKNKDMVKKKFDCTCPTCGGHVDLLMTTENAETMPISYYAYTKLAQEKMLEMMCPVLGIPYTIFRYQNVYGAGQSLSNPYTGILSIFSKQLLSNHELNIFEDGHESRDFVHVKDIAHATAAALTNTKSNNEIINLGNGEGVSVLEVANTLKAMYNSESVIKVSGDFRVGDIRHNIADICKAQELLGYKPEYDFEKGMKEFSLWVKEEVEAARVSIENKEFENSLAELKSSGMMYITESE